MKRAVIVVLDSFGIGASEDAASFGDQGADTLGHIAKGCATGAADERRAKGPLYLPNLTAIGLLEAHRESTGHYIEGERPEPILQGAWGHAKELSTGKDTPSGHWEIAGVPVLYDWGYFRDKTESFPPEFIDAFIKEAKVPGILGNCHASGTAVIADLGEEHCRTGKPILYTSADSVLQIAAHEEHFGLDRLLEICQIARKLLDPYNIGRVIARPFIGCDASDYARTGNRRDYAVPPPSPTVLDKLAAAGGEVISIGKIADIYAHQGITRKVKATGIDALFEATLTELDKANDNSIVFTNFVDFDSSFGHRRDLVGYAQALEHFDQLFPRLTAQLQPGDLLIITADHGCDPTWPGTDHTREHIPVLVYGPGIESGSLGRRQSFADIGQTLADYFGLEPMGYGDSFLDKLFPKVA